MSKFYIIDVDDWVCLYKDGQKIMEGHSFRYDELLEKVGVDVEVEYVDYDTPLMNYCEQSGNPPDSLEKVREIQNDPKYQELD